MSYNKLFILLLIGLISCGQKISLSKSMNKKTNFLSLDRSIEDPKDIIPSLVENAKINKHYSASLSEILEIPLDYFPSNSIVLAKANALIILYLANHKEFNYDRLFQIINLPRRFSIYNEVNIAKAYALIILHAAGYRKFNNINISCVNLPSIIFKDLSLINCNFKNIIVENINFNTAKIENTIFKSCNFKNCNPSQIYLKKGNSCFNLSENPIAFSPNGSIIAIGLPNKNLCTTLKKKKVKINKYDIEIYDTNTGEQKNFLRLNKKYRSKIIDLKFSPLGKELAISYISDNVSNKNPNSGIVLWDSDTKKFENIIKDKKYIYENIKFFTDGSLILFTKKNLSYSNDNTSSQINEEPYLLKISKKLNEVILYNRKNKTLKSLTSYYPFYKFNISYDQSIIGAGRNLTLWKIDNQSFKNISKNKKINGLLKTNNSFHLPCNVLKKIHNKEIIKTRFSKDYKYIFTATKDNNFKKIKLEDILNSNNKNIKELEFLNKKYFEDLKDFVISNDTLITISGIIKNDKKVYDRLRFWDLNKKILFQIYQTKFNDLSNLHVSSNSNTVFCVSEKNAIIKVNINQTKRKAIKQHFDNQKPINSILFFTPENFLISKSKDKEIYFWNIFNGNLIKKVYDNEDKLERIKQFSKAGEILTKFFENFTMQYNKNTNIKDSSLEKIKYSKKTPEVIFLNYKNPKENDDEKYEISNGYDHTPSYLINNDEMEEYSIMEMNHKNINYSNYYDSNEKILINTDKDEQILILNITKGEVDIRYTLKPKPRKKLSKVVISNDMNKIALVYKSKIYIIDANTGEQLRYIDAHKHKITNIKFSKNDEILGSTSGKHLCKLWDINKGWQKHLIQGKKEKESIINDFCFSKKDKFFISVGNKNSIIIRDLENEKVVQVIDLKDEIYKVAISANERYLATSGFGIIRIWKSIMPDIIENSLIKNQNFPKDVIEILISYIDCLVFGIKLMNIIGPKTIYANNTQFNKCIGIDENTKKYLYKNGSLFS